MVESGKWKVESGKWKVESGKSKVESGKSKVESRKSKVESGKNDEPAAQSLLTSRSRIKTQKAAEHHQTTNRQPATNIQKINFICMFAPLTTSAEILPQYLAVFS